MKFFLSLICYCAFLIPSIIFGNLAGDYHLTIISLLCLILTFQLTGTDSDSDSKTPEP